MEIVKQLSREDHEVLADYRNLLTLVSDRLSQGPRKIVASRAGSNFAKFLSLSVDQQLAIVGTLQLYLSLIEEAEEAFEDVFDSRRILWRAILKLGVVPTSDLMEFIESQDVIEIYNTQFTQIFRNLRFLELCSYTLEEMTSYECWELFYRDPAVTQKLMEIGVAAIQGKFDCTMPLPIGDHLIEECFSLERRRFTSRFKYFSPLFDRDGTFVAMITILEAEPEKQTLSNV